MDVKLPEVATVDGFFELSTGSLFLVEQFCYHVACEHILAC